MAFKYCNKTLVLLTLVSYIQWSLSWPSEIRRLSVCTDFHVSHSSHSHRISADSVTVTLKQNGSEKSCVNPSTQYHIEFRSNERTLVNGKDVVNRITGILVNQIFADGEVPSGEIKGKKEYLPKNTVHGVCGPWSVSHSCNTNLGCKLGHDGFWLNITYESPSRLNRVHDIVFKYVVVLSTEGGIGKFIDNQTVVFPVCRSPMEPVTTTPPTEPMNTTEGPTPGRCSTPLEPHNTNSAKEPVQQYCPDFDLKEGAEKKTGHCGKKATIHSNETHIYKDNTTGITYVCHTDIPIKKVPCTPTCEEDNKQWCCRNEISRMRPREFKCHASSALNPGVTLTEETEMIVRKGVLRLQTKKCECYLCTDIVCDNCSSQNGLD